MNCIICCKEINIDESNSKVYIREFARKAEGTTISTKYIDKKVKPCKDCYDRVKRVERIESFLFYIGAIPAVYGTLLLTYEASAGTDVIIYAFAGIFLMCIASFLPSNRVKIHEDSVIKKIEGRANIDKKYSASKVLIRTRENEQWWL